MIKGDLITHGANVVTYAIEGGLVGAIDIQGKVLARGEGSNAVLVTDRGSTPLTDVHAKADAGETLVVKDGEVMDRTVCRPDERDPAGAAAPAGFSAFQASERHAAEPPHPALGLRRVLRRIHHGSKCHPARRCPGSSRVGTTGFSSKAATAASRGCPTAAAERANLMATVTPTRSSTGHASPHD